MNEPVLTDIGLDGPGHVSMIFCDGTTPIAPMVVLEGIDVSLEFIKTLGGKPRSEVLEALFACDECNFSPFKNVPVK